MEQTQKNFSIIIPVYNEATIIKQTVEELDAYLRKLGKNNYEIILVNDGSSDDSATILASIVRDCVNKINHPYNMGYGAALKTGARHAKFDTLAFYDGDGQHNPEDLVKLFNKSDSYDMVVGNRQGYKGPLWRQPGKKIINLIANYLVKFKILDLNSGLRVVDKQKFAKFAHLYPNGFSLSTTITLAFIKHGFTVGYEPITIKPRVGKSSLKLTDGFKAINLVIRMIMLFSPLRIFLPIGFAVFSIGFISLIRDVFFVNNINDNTVLMLVSSLIIFSFGLIADQLASIRREIKA